MIFLKIYPHGLQVVMLEVNDQHLILSIEFMLLVTKVYKRMWFYVKHSFRQIISDLR